MILQWIDIWDADGHLTYFELMCCGWFTAESQLHYRWTDIPPFGVLDRDLRPPVRSCRVGLANLAGSSV